MSNENELRRLREAVREAEHSANTILRNEKGLPDTTERWLREEIRDRLSDALEGADSDG